MDRKGRILALRSFVDGLLFGERFGSGETRVVALHGWGRDRHDFVEVLEGLGAVALDLPGFGASPPPTEVMGAAGYAVLVASLVEELDSPQVVVGHSFGGRVATVLAATRPELVAGLVLVGVPLLRPVGRPVRKPSLVYRLVRWGNRIGLVSDGRLEREKRRRGSADYRAVSGVMRDILVKVVDETYEDELARLACPVRMVWGKNDREVPLEVARRASELMDSVGIDIEIDVVEHGGHDLLRQAPDRVRLAIEGLLMEGLLIEGLL